MSSGSLGGSTSQQGAAPPADANSFDPEAENDALATYLLIVCSAVSAAVIIWKILDVSTKYARTVVCLGNDHQRYFAIPSARLAQAKRHILYAPILSKRHNREFQLSSAVNVGTLPTRFQLLFLIGYFATNVAFCVINVPYAADLDEVASELRNRTGVLATVNMIPLFLLAGRNNPLIFLLGISFDTYNLIHRWFGRIVILEALAHTLSHLAKYGWGPAFESIFESDFLTWGFVAVCSFAVIGIQAWSPIRHAFYEVFKMVHICLAALAIIALWYHLQEFSQIMYLYAVIGIWAADRVLRVSRVLYYNFGGSRTKTLVEALPGNACRVTVTAARPWKTRPGQHAYLYMPSIGFWQSHPFTVAWSEGVDDLSSEKLVSTRQELSEKRKSRVSFIIRGRTGFTGSLYRKVAAMPGGRMETACFVEGPYGVRHPLESYGTVVLFAGGVGITHQVPYVQQLVSGFAEGTVATRKVLLVWTIQSPEHLEWIRPWMTEILAMERRRDILRIMLFVSQPRSSKEIHSPSSTVQMFPGRPNIDTLLGMEQEQQVGAMAVSVCGPGSLSDEVRRAARLRQSRSTIDFIEEAFSW